MQNTSRKYVNDLPFVLPLPSQHEQFQQVYFKKASTFHASLDEALPWLLTKNTGDALTVYCRDCKKAKLTENFARVKKQPPLGRKKEYLQRHTDSKG